MSYYKGRWIYIWPQSGPAPNLWCHSALQMHVFICGHTSPSCTLDLSDSDQTRRAETVCETWSKFWKIQCCSLISVRPRQDVLYRRRCLHEMDLMLVSRVFLLLRPHYRLYRTTVSTIKWKEKSPIFLFSFTLFFHSFISHIHHSWVRQTL